MLFIESKSASMNATWNTLELCPIFVTIAKYVNMQRQTKSNFLRNGGIDAFYENNTKIMDPRKVGVYLKSGLPTNA